MLLRMLEEHLALSMSRRFPEYIRAKDHRKHTALSFAAARGLTDTLLELIRLADAYNTDPSHRLIGVDEACPVHEDGSNPLHYATFRAHQSVLPHLLQLGCSPFNANNGSFLLAQMFACHRCKEAALFATQVGEKAAVQEVTKIENSFFLYNVRLPKASDDVFFRVCQRPGRRIS